MASVYKPKGSKYWRAVIRMKSHPTVCDHFERKQEAEDWAKEVERQTKLGQYKFDQHKKLHTFNELIDRYALDGVLEHHRSAEDTDLATFFRQQEHEYFADSSMRAVQENQNLLLQVDHSDRPIGLVEKKNAHLKGILHRAFSIFIFREVESSSQLLLQQRALHKYHSGGLWTNTCCSHAEPDIPIETTASNRLQTEMGFSCPISFLRSFYYKTDVGNGMTEHEIDHVFAAFYNPPHIHLNPEEANAFKWINIKDLEKDLMIKRHEFTAWFPEALDIALKFLDKRKVQER